MATEVCSYRLSLQGKPVGNQVLSTSERGINIFLEAKMQLQGSLGNVTVNQQSKLHREKMTSYFFNEETIEGGNKRQFNVTFDYQKGLVRASRSSQDQTEMPLTQNFSDPLSMLYQLRQLKAEDAFWQIPMLGKAVSVERVGEKTLESSLGETDCFVYKLWPGGSFAYVSKAAPHHIMMLIQKVDGRSLEAQLIRVSHESNTRPRQNQNNNQRRRAKKHSRKHNPHRQN